MFLIFHAGIRRKREIILIAITLGRVGRVNPDITIFFVLFFCWTEDGQPKAQSVFQLAPPPPAIIQLEKSLFPPHTLLLLLLLHY